MTILADSSMSGNTRLAADRLEDGPVAGALLPLVRINGHLFVVEHCLHFFSAVPLRPTRTEVTPRLTTPEAKTELTVCTTESRPSAPALRS